ncbi:hypothetical protein D5P86_00335 [Salmonella enterica subsp. enterica serovar Infantis]|nr:hypothetical protein [Salmonella enterica subsp. enterica serovar Infantis]
MPSTIGTILIAYYIVGIIVFLRDIKSIDRNDPALEAFNREMNQQSNMSVLWTGIKLFVFVVLVHIPLWIIRV